MLMTLTFAFFFILLAAVILYSLKKSKDNRPEGRMGPFQKSSRRPRAGRPKDQDRAS